MDYRSVKAGQLRRWNTHTDKVFTGARAGDKFLVKEVEALGHSDTPCVEIVYPDGEVRTHRHNTVRQYSKVI